MLSKSSIVSLCLILLLTPNLLKASTNPNAESYNKYAHLIAEEANANGVDPQTALFIADKESTMNPEAKGDFSTTTMKYTSFGIFQIHLSAHPEITEKEALNAWWSIKWAIKELANGKCFEWSTCPLTQSG